MDIQTFLSWVQAVSAVVTAVGLAVSLAFLSRQLRLMSRANRATIYQNVPALMIQIDQFFINNSDLRPFIYGGQPLPTDEQQRERVLSAAEMLFDFMDYVFTIAPAMPEYQWEGWYRYFRELLQTSSAMQTFWRSKRYWYDDTFMQQTLDSYCPPEAPLPTATSQRIRRVRRGLRRMRTLRKES